LGAATLWDTAGQERFRTLTSSFYRGAQGILLVYDVTRSDSFDSLEQWLAEVEHFCPDGGKNVAKLLVGNKADLEDQRKVDFSDGEAWARSQGMMFMETSAKTSKHIKEAFDEVLERILESPAMSAGTGPPKTAATDDASVDIEEGTDGASAGSGCCG
jgi:Ras-related protein Rab-18